MILTAESLLEFHKQLEKSGNHINVLLLIFDSGEVFQDETSSDLVI